MTTLLCGYVASVNQALQNIIEIGLKKIWSVRTKIALIERIFPKKKFADRFLLFVLIYPLSKLGAIGQIPCVLIVYSVRCRWKNWFEKISAKCVKQTGNFCLLPKTKTAISPPIFNLWFLFYIRDFIWIIALRWMVPVFRFFEYVNFERKEQRVNSRS